MQYNFDAFPDRRTTESIKWKLYESDVLPMWVADMDFVSPEPVIRALHQRIDHGIFGYPGDLPGLREIITERLEMHFGWKIEPGAIVFQPGVVTGFNMAAHAMVEQGGVLIQTPVYMPFLAVARNVGGQRQEMRLSEGADGHYGIDWDAFEQAITPETRMFLLCNPHNPVGRVFTQAELECMAQICLRHNLMICSDEIHCDLVYTGHKHIPIASIDPAVAQRTVTLMAPSKTFNVAGLHCSFAIVPDPELRKRFVNAGKGMAHGVNLLGLAAARAAYTEGQEWLEQMLVYLEGNRNWLCRFINDAVPGVRVHAPEGTYLAWLDFREAGLDEMPEDFLLKKARVGTVDGTAFGAGGEGFVRLNFGCPRAMLVEACERIKTALENR